MGGEISQTDRTIRDPCGRKQYGIEIIRANDETFIFDYDLRGFLKKEKVKFLKYKINKKEAYQ